MRSEGWFRTASRGWVGQAWALPESIDRGELSASTRVTTFAEPRLPTLVARFYSICAAVLPPVRALPPRYGLVRKDRADTRRLPAPASQVRGVYPSQSIHTTQAKKLRQTICANEVRANNSFKNRCGAAIRSRPTHNRCEGIAEFKICASRWYDCNSGEADSRQSPLNRQIGQNVNSGHLGEAYGFCRKFCFCRPCWSDSFFRVTLRAGQRCPLTRQEHEGGHRCESDWLPFDS
jgi:hypothetical protein